MLFKERYSGRLDMAAKTDRYIDSLTANGEISFTLENFCRALEINRSAGLTALGRLKKQRKVVSPSRGYYLILTPEFRNKGCLPADFFIDDLMHHLNVDYYVSLLSAALYYGAAHQQPQTLQVMLSDKKKNIQCAQVSIEFIKNAHFNETPLKKIKTRTGYMNVSTPEGTAMDMMRYMQQCGGLSRIVTVVDELAESIDPDALKQLAEVSNEYFWVHRLGFILDELGKVHLAEALYKTISKNKKEIVPLAPYNTTKNAPRDKKWQIAINGIVESDLDNTY